MKYDFEKIPATLRGLRQWVCWRAVKKKNGKTDKLPINPKTAKLAKSNDPATWGTFERAVEHWQGHKNTIAGIGFVFTKEDPYAGLDIDRCVVNGELESWAKTILDALNTYIEISPSGSGIHAIIKIKGKLPASKRKGNIEFYSSGRFFTMSGVRVTDYKKYIRELTTEQLETTLPMLFEENSKPQQKTGAPSQLSDEEILRLCQNAHNSEKFKKLWSGDWSDYPSQSEADAALCLILAFYTKDPEQIDRIFRQSKLCRPKWGERRGSKTYGEITIAKAIEGTSETYQKKKTGGHPLASLDPDLPWNVAGTDVFFASIFVKRFKHKIRYVPTWGWLVWDGKRWMRDTENKRVEGYVSELGQIFLKWATGVEDIELRKKLLKLAVSVSSIQKIRNTLAMASTFDEVLACPEEFDQDPWLLNCENGVVDLRTGEIKKHNSGLNLTKIAPYAYDPSADRTLFHRFLDEIFCGDRELIRFVQRALGYSATGSVEEHKFFICWGTGRNGKSTLLDVCQEVLGDYAKTVASDLLLTRRRTADSHPTIKADLFRARFCVAQETEEGRFLACSTVKNLTGGERIKARFMRQDYFEFDPSHTIWLATNYKPEIKDTTPAMKERVVLIPFRAFFDQNKRDPRLKNKLINQGAAILSWLVAGAVEWHKKGLGKAQAVEIETRRYLTDMDRIQAWLEDCCTLDPRAATAFKDLYESYHSWADGNSLDEEPLSKKAFAERLSEKGFEGTKDRLPGHTRKVALRRGLKLKVVPIGTDGTDQGEINIYKKRSKSLYATPGTIGTNQYQNKDTKTVVKNRKPAKPCGLTPEEPGWIKEDFKAVDDLVKGVPDELAVDPEDFKIMEKKK